METSQSKIFDLVIWTGAAISLLGLLGLAWCILTVARAKRANLDDAAMREVLRKALPLNMGALFLSVIGLMAVVVGIFLA
ncbi:MAG: hypothetical protein WA989_14115 [Henriciella sp.]|uniref:hypothetical protein n=1 Tax=Henriciella sp. TaxID=1968823 RepID=UPI003C721337